MNDKDTHKPVKHQGSASTSPYPVSRLGAHMPLVELAQEISQADTMVNSRVSSQLRLIAEQIRHLQDEARKVLEKGQLDQELHHAECNFKRQPGKTYYLYRKATGQSYFSMLSPEDWQHQPPHEFIAAYKLEADMSWTTATEPDTSAETQALVKGLLDKHARES